MSNNTPEYAVMATSFLAGDDCSAIATIVPPIKERKLLRSVAERAQSLARTLFGGQVKVTVKERGASTGVVMDRIHPSCTEVWLKTGREHSLDTARTCGSVVVQVLRQVGHNAHPAQ